MPQGAFYAYPNIGVALGKNGIDNTLQFSERLLAEPQVAVVPGEAFGTDQHVRISYATSMHELERGLDRIHQFIVELVGMEQPSGSRRLYVRRSGADRSGALVSARGGEDRGSLVSRRREVPLLVKFLFTSARLSVQVHPDDGEEARAARPRCGTSCAPVREPKSRWDSASRSRASACARHPLRRDRTAAALDSGQGLVRRTSLQRAQSMPSAGGWRCARSSRTPM